MIKVSQFSLTDPVSCYCVDYITVTHLSLSETGLGETVVAPTHDRKLSAGFRCSVKTAIIIRFDNDLALNRYRNKNF